MTDLYYCLDGTVVPECYRYGISTCPPNRCFICTNVRDGGEICTSQPALQQQDRTQAHCRRSGSKKLK